MKNLQDLYFLELSAEQLADAEREAKAQQGASETRVITINTQTQRAEQMIPGTWDDLAQIPHLVVHFKAGKQPQKAT